MALILFLSCCCWRVITQSLVAIQCNMFRCFEDDFYVFLVLGFENLQIHRLSQLFRRSAIAVLQPPRPNIAATTKEKAAFFSFLGTLLSCQRPGFANAYFPFQIFKYSQILQPQRQSFSYFSQNTRSLINPFHLTVNCQQNIYIIARSTLGKNENIHNCHTFFKMAAPECIFDSCCYQRKA